MRFQIHPQPRHAAAVYHIMVNAFAQPRKSLQAGGYVVRRPMASDAMGMALRASFGKEIALPSSMAMLVARLDTIA